MGICFLCDSKLYGERTRVCSSITPHSNVPYPEKIAELMGEEFVVIVTPADHMCKRCTSLLTHMDKLENDLKLVKNAMLSYIQKKYGVLPPDQPVKALDIVNGHLKTDELEVGQRKVPSGLTIRDNSVSTPLKMLKTQQQDSASKMKIYKCGFCSFQSKELGHVRFHMRTHMNKKGDGEKVNQTVAKTLTPATQQKKRLYRCQVCSTSFDSRVSCLEHIQKDHNQQAAQPANEEKEAEEKQAEAEGKDAESENHATDQQSETPLDVPEEQEKGAVDTDMLLNENVPADEPATSEQHEQTHETGGAQEQEESMQVDQEHTAENSEQKGVEEEMAAISEENKTGDIDIESMLAAIHNDAPAQPTVDSDTQNIV